MKLAVAKQLVCAYLLHPHRHLFVEIPKYILEYQKTKTGEDYGMGMIAVTQPRRVAAMSLAKRVAEETNTKLGQLVFSATLPCCNWDFLIPPFPSQFRLDTV